MPRLKGLAGDFTQKGDVITMEAPSAYKGSRWTPETIEALQIHYAAELSYGKIAKALGKDFTSNMVAGQVKRLKLPTRSGAPRVPPKKYHRVYVPKAKRGSHLTVPKKAHPLVKRLYEIMIEKDVKIITVCTAVGMSTGAMATWRTVSEPKLTYIEACFNYLGYSLVPTPLGDD